MGKLSPKGDEFFENRIEITRISQETGVPEKYLIRLFASRWFLENIWIEQMLSKERLAEKLDISVSFINKLMKHEGLPFVKIGKLVRFRANQIQPWLLRRSLP